MNPIDLQQYIDENRIDGEIVRLETPTPTVQTAADAVGVSADQIIKSLLLIIHEKPVLAIACGTRPIDRRSIATHFDVGRRQVKFADEETVEAVTGYPAGGVPPFGHPELIETLIDPEVLTKPFVFGGGGDRHSLVRVAPTEIHRVTNATVLDISGK